MKTKADMPLIALLVLFYACIAAVLISAGVDQMFALLLTTVAVVAAVLLREDQP